MATQQPPPVDTNTTTTPVVPQSQIKRQPAPIDVPLNVTPIPLSEIDRAPAPLPVTSTPVIIPLSSIDTAPAAVTEDPAVANEASPVASDTADPSETVLPPPPPAVGVVRSGPIYLPVAEDGNVVVPRTALLNFLGNGVTVTSVNGLIANIAINGDGTADLGNWAFVGNTQYNLNGGLINNSDLSHGATAMLGLPANGDGNAIELLNYYGSLSLTAGAGPSQTKNWTFGSDGILTAPGEITTTGNITGDYFLGNTQGLVGSITNLDSLNFSVENISALVGNNGVNIGAGGFNNLVVLPDEVLIQNVPLTTAGNITANFFIGDGSQLTNIPTAPGNLIENGDSNVRIDVPNGNVTVSANTSSWTFNTTGDLTVPNYINFAGNTFIGDEPGSGSPAFRIVAPLTYGATIETDSNILGNSWTWTFGADGVLGAPGNITAPYFIGDGSQLTGLPDGTAITNGTSTIDIPTANGNIIVGVNNVGSIEFTADGINALNLSSLGNVTASANISGGNLIITGNVIGNVAGFAIGYRDIPQVSFTGNATLAATDAGKHYYSTLSTANVLTIADNSNVSWPVGTAISVVNRGTGNITVAQGSGVSLYLAGNSTSGNRLITTYGMATLLNVGANLWMINGTGVV